MYRAIFTYLVVMLLVAGCANPPAEAPGVTPIPEPTEPEAATPTPDASSEMDTTLELDRSFDLPFIPHDLETAPDGSLYAIELGESMVHKLDHNGQILASWGGVGSDPGLFAFDPPPDGPQLDGGFVGVGTDGRVYISDPWNIRVQVFDGEGSYLTEWQTYGPEDTPFNVPGPISVDPEGNVYVADFDGVHEFDPDGDYVKTIPAAGELAVDSQGNLITLVAFEGIALKYPAGGGEPTSWGGAGEEDGQFMMPIWVEVGPDDLVYIADHSGRVQMFTTDGEHLGTWDDPGNGDDPLSLASPIAFDENHQLYVGSKDRTTVYVLKP